MSIRSVLFAVLLFAFAFAPFSGNAEGSKAKKSATAVHSAKKKPVSSKSKKKLRKKPLTAAERRRMQRMKRTFVASSTLKPMAKQLFELRSKAAYAGVESFARKHAGTDEGAMANLVLGYAHVLDREYDLAIPYLKKAQTKPGELGDYAAYFVALAESGKADSAQMVAALSNFQQKYPDSVFARDAAAMYVSALLANGDAQKAIAVAQKYRTPTRADIELNLGRAYMKQGDTQKASEVLRHLYYTMPLSSEADSAFADLSSLGAVTGSFSERKTRADLLAQGRRYRDAAREYRDLLSSSPTAEQTDAIKVAMALAENRSGDSKDARKTLEELQVTGNANAQRLYYLLDMARDDGDENRFKSLLDELRQSAPTSNWFELGLISAGNMYLLKKDYDRAIDFYRELDQRFPSGRWGHYAHWKAAWLSLRQGRTEEARKGFEEQISKYPQSGEISAALYWRGRLAEDDRNQPLARAYYKKITDRFPNYYYADRARDRMKLIGSGSVASDPLLDHIPPLASVPTEFKELPPDDLRVQKAKLLENCAMYDFAIKELQLSPEFDSTTAAGEIARLYQEAGGYHRALNYMKRTVPSYFALDYSALPRSYWETLFPRPYWTDLKRFSAANSLDPYLVASLIRQESEFNPGAVSSAKALGLMQVMPATGKKLAKQAKLRRFTPEELLVPNTNLQLGTRYFKELLDHFEGRPEYALAAYNAGSNRVEDWLSEGKFRDPQEFVESIPFTETREYVQAIMRNATVYKKLYQNQ